MKDKGKEDRKVGEPSNRDADLRHLKQREKERGLERMSVRLWQSKKILKSLKSLARLMGCPQAWPSVKRMQHCAKKKKRPPSVSPLCPVIGYKQPTGSMASVHILVNSEGQQLGFQSVTLPEIEMVNFQGHQSLSHSTDLLLCA